MRAAQDFFEENKATLHGAVTYPTSAKHLALYHKFGYKPKSLTAVMSRALERGTARPALPKPVVKGALTVRRFSGLEETKKKAALTRFHRITNGVCRGLEVTLHFDEDKFSGSGVYLFGAVLERFLGMYCSLNSFTRTVFLSRSTSAYRHDARARRPI